MCLAIIQLYFITTFSYILSSVESPEICREKVKTEKKRILFQLKKSTLAEVSNFISLNVDM